MNSLFIPFPRLLASHFCPAECPFSPRVFFLSSLVLSSVDGTYLSENVSQFHVTCVDVPSTWAYLECICVAVCS